jgi:hypothetical protein
MVLIIHDNKDDEPNAVLLETQGDVTRYLETLLDGELTGEDMQRLRDGYAYWAGDIFFRLLERHPEVTQ